MLESYSPLYPASLGCCLNYSVDSVFVLSNDFGPVYVDPASAICLDDYVTEFDVCATDFHALTGLDLFSQSLMLSLAPILLSWTFALI